MLAITPEPKPSVDGNYSQIHCRRVRAAEVGDYAGYPPFRTRRANTTHHRRGRTPSSALNDRSCACRGCQPQISAVEHTIIAYTRTRRRRPSARERRRRLRGNWLHAPREHGTSQTRSHAVVGDCVLNDRPCACRYTFARRARQPQIFAAHYNCLHTPHAHRLRSSVIGCMWRRHTLQVARNNMSCSIDKITDNKWKRDISRLTIAKLICKLLCEKKMHRMTPQPN